MFSFIQTMQGTQSTEAELKETKKVHPEVKRPLTEANDVFISVLKHENSPNVTFKDLKIESPYYLSYKHPSDFCATVQDKDKKIEVGVAEVKWNRDTQEDAVAISINEAAKVLSLLPPELRKIAHELTFEELNQSMGEPGSTGVVATCWKEGKEAHVNVANAGDSAAYLVVVRNGKLIKSELINTLHRPNVPEEAARIKAHGATVWRNRVNGSLAVSRAFGDKSYQSAGVTAKPEVKDIPPEALQPGDKAYVIVACDGLEALSIQEIGQMVAANSVKSPADIANILVSNNVGTRKCYDNTSVVCIPVSDIPVSAGVFDGHGGDETSRQLALNFYKVLLKHALALAEPKKIKEVLAAIQLKKAEQEKVQRLHDMLNRAVQQLSHLKKEQELFDINVFAAANNEGVKIRFGNKDWIGGPDIQKVRLEICQLAKTVLNAISEFNYYGCDVVIKDQDKLNETDINEFITGVGKILSQYEKNKQAKALQKALLKKEFAMQEVKEKPVLKAEIKSAETNTLKPEISLQFSLSPNPNLKDYFIVSPKIILQDEEKRVKPANIVFIVDRSGSMSGDRIHQVKESLKLIIRDKLSERDIVQIVTFDHEAAIHYSGKKSELTDINGLIDKIYARGGTNFTKPFELLKPEMFGENEIPFICFLTDGEDDGPKSPEVILKELNEKFGSSLPPIVALGISKGCRIETTKKFDTPQERGLYAESASDIVRQFGEVTDLIGKQFYPVSFKFSTEYETRGGEIGRVRSDGLPLQSGLWRVSMDELSASSKIRGEITVGSEKFEFTHPLPKLEGVGYEPQLVKAYYANKLKSLSTKDSDKKANAIQVQLAKNELLRFKLNDEEFEENYKDLIYYISILEKQYSQEGALDNTASADKAAFGYSLASASPASFNIKTTVAKLVPSEDVKDFNKTLSFNILPGNLDEVFNKKETIYANINLANVESIYFNPKEALFSKYDSKPFETLLDVVMEVRRTFHKADTTPKNLFMSGCVTTGSGNPLARALFSAYLINCGIQNQNFMPGTVKVFNGLTDSMDQLHFCTVYQTEQGQIYLIDPANDDEHCIVDLTNREARDHLVEYYKTKGLSGILRDTFAMFDFEYHEKDLVKMPSEHFTKLDHLGVPDHLLCPVTNKVMRMPVCSEKNGFQCAFDGENASSKEEKVNLIPATKEIQQIKHLAASHMDTLRLKMHVSSQPSALEEKSTAGSFETPPTKCSSTLFSVTDKDISNPIIYITGGDIFPKELKVIFPNQAARDLFLKNTDLTNNPHVITRLGYDDCFYLLREADKPFRPRVHRIDFGDPAAVLRFIKGLGIQGDDKFCKDTTAYKNIECYVNSSEDGMHHSPPRYLNMLSSNPFSPHYILVNGLEPGSPLPETYLQINTANGKAKFLTKDEYLAEQSQLASLKKPGFGM